MDSFLSTPWARRTRLVSAGLTTLICILTISTADAQVRKNCISFGFDMGGNKYYGNFTDNKFGFGGDLFIRWNIMDWLSLHAQWQGEQLRYGVGPVALGKYPDYFGTNVVIVTSKYPEPNSPTSHNIVVDPTNVVRTGEWQLLLSWNIFPDQTFVPYFMGGIEEFNWEPKTANNGQPLPNNARAGYSKDILAGVLGVGYELYVTNKVAFNGKVLLHLTGTDWLDDYSNPATHSQDVFLSAGVGFSYVIFSPPEEKAPVITTAGNTYVTNNKTENTYTTTYVNRTDTIYVQGDVDTVFLYRPPINTIVNFPGTLFIVNTDEFNMKVPGNASNLRRIKELVDQCPDMRIEIQGFASNEGPAARNQELSEMRAARIKTWLLEQGVSGDKISGTVGYGTSRPMIEEPTGVTPARLEEIRVQNRRIAVRVTRACAP